MYFRRKTSAGRAYLQIVESRRDGDQVRQQVIATLGRFDELQASGQLERLVRSGARFAAKAMVLSAVSNDAAIKIAVRRIGPELVFERLWEETGCRAVIAELVGKRKHGFALERAVFLTVLHRLFVSGSDRAADRWREDYAIAGVDGLDLHHLYRAMAWLGEELPQKEQDGRTPFAPRCLKDVIEERLFAHRRDLLTRLDLVFMDTTSLYFEGAGGQTLGEHGYSKDDRPDLRQMAPASDAVAIEMPNAMRLMRIGSTAKSLSASWSCATAMMARPTKLRVSTSCSVAISNSDTRNGTTMRSGTSMKPKCQVGPIYHAST